MLAALLAAAGPAWAQALSVEPVTIHLASGQMADVLTVTNQTDTPSSFQVRAFAWSAPTDQDQLTPTDAIILSPPLGTIAPGARQLIRLVLRQAPQNGEATYRIWLDQIPAPAAPGAIRIALRLSIPIFAEPPGRVLPDLHWRLEKTGAGADLVVRNNGNRHQTVRNLRLTAPDGTMLRIEGAPSPYILAAETRHWHVGFPAEQATSTEPLHLTADTEDGHLDQTVVFGPSGD